MVVDSVVLDAPNVAGLSPDPVANEKGDFDLVSMPVVDSVDGLSFDGVANENAGLDGSVVDDDDVFVVNEGVAPKSGVFSLFPSSFCEELSAEGFSVTSLGELGLETNTKEDDGETSVASAALEAEVSLLPVSDNEPNEKLFVVDANDDDWGTVVLDDENAVVLSVVVDAAPVPNVNVFLVTVDCSFSVDDPGLRLGEETLLESLSAPDTS